VALTEYLISEADAHLAALGLSVASPRDAERRGSHVSLAHDLAWPITRALIDEAHLIPDFRTPDNIRLGLSPLFTSFVDVHTAVQRIKRLVSADTHRGYVDTDAAVT